MIQNGGQVSYEEHGDALVVVIRGEIDHHCAVSVRTGVDDVLATGCSWIYPGWTLWTAPGWG